MKAIVLAAGYATRLRPLTERVAKPLLPIAGRPMLDWLLDALEEVPALDAVHVVTNGVYADAFRRFAAAQERRVALHVHDDGTRSNDDRLGAIGDIRFTVEQAGLEGEDLLVLAGDNLFDASLADFAAFWREKGVASALGVYDVGDRGLARQYGIVEVAADGRVTGFLEKPQEPPSTLAATAAYIYHREHAALLPEYLAAGGSRDQPGRLVAWLHEREPVYAYPFRGEWLDIGDHGQLLEADNRRRLRLGLPTRTEYAP